MQTPLVQKKDAGRDRSRYFRSKNELVMLRVDNPCELEHLAERREFARLC
jgi:hypothetical protein